MDASTSKSPVIAAGSGALRRQAGSRASAGRGIGLATIRTVLRLTFGLVPIVAGLDKFTNLLVDWKIYLSPAVLSALPVDGSTFMGVVGVIEIAAGILVLARPRTGAYLVAGWLACIALSLVAGGNHFDVAVRDLVMAVGAFTLASLPAAGAEGSDA